MSNIGLQLLSLYQEICKTKSAANNDPEGDEPAKTTVKEIARSLNLALEKGYYNEAHTLLNIWATSFPQEKESSVLYHCLRVETFLRQIAYEKDRENIINLLNDAIESANDFFIVNKDNGHTMDDEARSFYFQLLFIIGSFDKTDLNEWNIMELELPEILPAEADITPCALIRKGLKRHTNKFGQLSLESRHLLRCICNEFGLNEISN